MPEEIKGKKIFSLLEVAKSIQKTIADRYKSAYWVKAEMNKVNFYQQSGHCYPDLVEKKDGKVVAQIRANLWKDDYNRINSAFQRVLKEPLKDGIKILFLATIGYHPEYGLTLRIIDIDPGFTLGDLEKEKQETIEKLREEGIFHRNKELEIPLLPQRIAVISVQTSKGYADFIDVLEAANRSWHYSFFHLLFPSVLQGDGAVTKIIGQLNRIRKVIHHFDVVAIIRGGGGDIGLSCYNNYLLAKEIAMFPVPVITGIGHATNQTVVEMVAFENAITPTQLAEFLVQKFHNFSVPLQQAEESIIDKSKSLLHDEGARFSGEVKLLCSVTRNLLIHHQNEIKQQSQSLIQQLSFRIKGENSRLVSAAEKMKRAIYQFLATEKQILAQIFFNLKKDLKSQLNQWVLIMDNTLQNLDNLRPENVLKRGYSITLLKGKALRSSNRVKEGELLDTLLFEGRVKSTVKSIETSKKNEGQSELH